MENCFIVFALQICSIINIINYYSIMEYVEIKFLFATHDLIEHKLLFKPSTFNLDVPYSLITISRIFLIYNIMSYKNEVIKIPQSIVKKNLKKQTIF